MGKSKKIVIGVFSVLVMVVIILAIVLNALFVFSSRALNKGWDTNPLSHREGVEDLISITPSAKQLAHSEMEYYAFFHFGINTFYDREWGTGDEDPMRFDPSALDTDQWIESVAASGAKGAIITAKHHDGFCLWPTDTTEFSIKNSAYKNGAGDIVGEFAESCRKYGLKFGFYLSPWDMNAETYGQGDAYNDFYLQQLTELLTWYGDVFEVWFDGARDPAAPDQHYDFDRFYETVYALQPDALTAIAGPKPDVRWVGNEEGLADRDNWNIAERSGETYWAPTECDVSIRDGWFYHEDQKPKSLKHLMHIYRSSVGNGSSLLLNVPPDTRGLIADADVERLREFGEAIDALYSDQVIAHVRTGTSETIGQKEWMRRSLLNDREWSHLRLADDEYMLEFDLREKAQVRHLVLSEDIRFSQRIERIQVFAKSGNKWIKVADRTAVGNKCIIQLNSILTPKTRYYRVVIAQSRSNPVLRQVAFYK